ncbi:Cache sensor protein [Aquiflexum sp.]|uniref:Cache sensor protein n=1 Tax=Aquiflexum sp. TaxID=1872584 RepID=UPI0035940CD3
MRNTGYLVSLLLVVVCSCSPTDSAENSENWLELQAMASLMDYDLKELEDEIISLGQYTESLFEHREEWISKADQSKYRIKGVAANAAPDADSSMSSLYIPDLGQDLNAVMEMIYITNPLDSLFREIVKRRSVVSQVYFNSSVQLNRLYPPYDIYNMLEPDLDVTSFNFYYEGDEEHNPSKSAVWVQEIYIDPVGRGWMISLLQPVYYANKLMMVLAFDITVNDIIESYINKSNKTLLIIDATGTVVAGKNKAIEALSLPPLKNHTYTQTITSDSYRVEDFNLFKSKSREVRKMASDIILAGEKMYVLNDNGEKITIRAERIDRLNWFILDLNLQ